MYMFDDHYHKLNQIFLRILGLWPYGKTKYDHFRATCFFIILVSHTFVQLAQLLITDFSIIVIIRILSEFLPILMCLVKFNMFFLETKKLKQILEEMTNNRRILTEAQEIEIIEHYANQGRIFTIIYTLLMTFILYILATIELFPSILDCFWPLNESRTHNMLFLTQYHISEGIQYYSCFLYFSISVGIGCFSVICITTMITVAVLHCCAIFKICSYRIKQSVDEKIIMCSNKRNVIVKRIIRTVELHQNAKRLFKLCIPNFGIYFFIMVVVGICSCVANLYRLLYSIICMDNFPEIMLALGNIITHEVYLVVTTYMGQNLVNHADELFNAIYMSLWYKAPVTIQKLLLFMMQVASKSVVPKVGGIYCSVMESFTTVMSTVISYMMVLYSVNS